MRKLLFVIAAFLAAPALACEPCIEVYDVQRTYDKADAVIIGKRLTPLGEGEGTGIAGPEFVEIEVLQVMKGKLEQSKIRAHAWSGMCSYGIVTPPGETGVIFLKKEADGTYHSVGYPRACSTDFLSLKEGTVQVEYGKPPVKLEELKAQLEKGTWKASR